MPRLVVPPEAFKALIRERRRTGADRLDEVWDGVYVMSPEADNQHQKLAFEFAAVFREAMAGLAGGEVYPTINVSDRVSGWKKNYRIPDASVFLPGNPAQDCESHWLGGPDFAVEVVSPRDRSRKKFDFYGKVGVRELLILDRRPWRLELHRREGDAWAPPLVSTPDRPEWVASAVLPLSFRLAPAEPRPKVEVTRADGAATWSF